MTNFILISVAMVALALLLLVPAILSRPTQKIDADTREHNVRIARERLVELEKEHAKADLSDEEFNQAKQDLQIALAQDLSHVEADSNASKSERKINLLTLLVLALIVPLGVVALYQHIGAPQHLDLHGPGQPIAQQQASDIDKLIIELEERLQQNPDNPQGWFLLGRTYMRLGRYDDAVRAYEALDVRMPGDPSVQLSLADALAMQNGGELNTRAVQLLEQVLQKQPNSVTALWLLGQNAARQNQPRQALRYWQRAYPLLATQPEAQQQLGQRIAALQDQLDMQPAQQTSSKATSDAISNQAAESASLTVSVMLDSALQDKVSPDDVVFIYAKARQGPPMPLAVARKKVADLPVEVTLDDSMAMLPQMRLSTFEQVLVGARISKSGQAIPQAGDLQSAEVAASNMQTEAILLMINQLRD